MHFPNEIEDQDVLTVFFSFNIYEVYMVMEDSKDILILSIDNVTNHMEYCFFFNWYQNHIKNNGSMVYWYMVNSSSQHVLEPTSPSGENVLDVSVIV